MKRCLAPAGTKAARPSRNSTRMQAASPDNRAGLGKSVAVRVTLDCKISERPDRPYAFLPMCTNRTYTSLSSRKEASWRPSGLCFVHLRLRHARGCRVRDAADVRRRPLASALTRRTQDQRAAPMPLITSRAWQFVTGGDEDDDGRPGTFLLSAQGPLAPGLKTISAMIAATSAADR